jgi:phage-related minor tail protein
MLMPRLAISAARFFLMYPFAVAAVLALALGWYLLTADSRKVSRSGLLTGQALSKTSGPG